jgi:Spy/CpxP family protein refolding chaperone
VRLLPLLALLAAGPALAQAPAPPLSLPGNQMQALLEGQGMGLARVADLSGYPGPLHVLELADSLALSEEQADVARALRAGVLQEAPALGARIVESEREVDELFAGGAVDDDALGARVHEIARLHAELRLVHLRAHLAMREALTPAQNARYHALRHGAEASPHGVGGHRHGVGGHRHGGDDAP